MNSRCSSRAARATFLILWLAVWFALNAVASVGALRTTSPAAFAAFLLIQLLNLGIAYGFVQTVLALCLPAQWPSRLALIPACPRVAVLYTTCDDLVVPCLESLSRLRYANCEVFVLDDSRLPCHRDEVSRVAAENGFCVLTRDANTGFKAGSLNNWLSKVSEEYEYFVIADADSVLPEEFLTQMLEYAEHPDNGAIAVFQSLLSPWNTDDCLSLSVTATLPVTLRKISRLMNRYGYPVCWGHNALYRTREVRAVGGFDERFSSEDFSLAIDLVSRGRRCCLVDVQSFERFPRSFQEYARRSAKWARQAIQLLLHKKKGALSLLTLAHLFMDAFGYVMPVLFAVAAVLVTWGGRSSLRDLASVDQIMAAREFPIMLGLMLFYVATLFADLPEAVLVRGIALSKYFRALWLRFLLGLYALVPIGRGVADGVLSRRARFEPTGERQVGGKGGGVSISPLAALASLTAVVFFGVLRNPLAVVFNWFWIVPLLSAPICILWMTTHRLAEERKSELQ